MKINLYDTIILLEKLGYDCVNIKELRETFFEQQETPPALPPPLPEPPIPVPPPVLAEGVYPSYPEAKAAAKVGEEPVYDDSLKGFVNGP